MVVYAYNIYKHIYKELAHLMPLRLLELGTLRFEARTRRFSNSHRVHKHALLSIIISAHYFFWQGEADPAKVGASFAAGTVVLARLPPPLCQCIALSLPVCVRFFCLAVCLVCQ